MKVKDSPQIHLTYCLNVHRGESWQENFDAIKDNALIVRDKISKGKSFGLGLRLGFEAASQLLKTEELERFSKFLKDEDLYVFTINGFPYGRFHHTSVKKDVYRPDWQNSLRRDYTIMLADILARLLPEAVNGSISTVPLSYKEWITHEQQVQKMVQQLADVAVHLNAIFERSGKDICIGLEPEPDCLLENTDEVINFFSGPLLAFGVEYIEQKHGLSNAEEILKRHIGVCFDTSHLAVEFENLSRSYQRLIGSGINICKVQLSLALELQKSPRALEQLKDFSDSVYLHQVKIRTEENEILSYPDMPEALEKSPSGRWRIHSHVPLFFTKSGELESTFSCLDAGFFNKLLEGHTPHLEIETYTFDVLPDFLRGKGVTQTVAEEYKWVLSKLEKQS